MQSLAPNDARFQMAEERVFDEPVASPSDLITFSTKDYISGGFFDGHAKLWPGVWQVACWRTRFRGQVTMWRNCEPGQAKAPQAISVRQHLSTSMVELAGLDTATAQQSVAASGGPSGSIGGKERKLEL